MSATREAKKMTRYTRYFVKQNKQLETNYRESMMKAFPKFMQQELYPNGKYTADEDLLKDDQWPFMVGDRVQVIVPNTNNNNNSNNSRRSSSNSDSHDNDTGKVGRITSLNRRANAIYVEGLGGTRKTLVPPHAFFKGQTKPVVDVPKSIPVKNVRLVVSIAETDSEGNEIEGKEKDVVVHSVFIDRENKYYDPDYNQFLPTRVLNHDREVVIPWPRPENLLEPSPAALSTASGIVGERTFFPTSILEPPLPVAALAQVRNIHSKFKRHKLITPMDIFKFTEPSMPITSSKREYLKKREERFGPNAEAIRPKKLEGQEFADIEEFIGTEIEKGLENRNIEENRAYSQYQ